MGKKPQILISNDDGIDAPGLYVLAKRLKQFADVAVVAPSIQQSAVGHAITVRTPLRAHEFRRDGKLFGYAVDGTPADCIKLAIRSLIKPKPDLIISGINDGLNTAVNVIYSGTVSAATEGTILGIPSIAVSIEYTQKPDFEPAAKVASAIAKYILKHGIPKDTILNINVPSIPAKRIKGIKFTRQGRSRWDDKFYLRKDPKNRDYYWLAGDMRILDHDENVDQVALRSGFVSVTPIHFDLTHHKFLEKMQKEWNGKFKLRF
ncbi:MAG TPA: 5'/3'-nucleotidase SurE [Candidatus Acidoferrales bacterium]|nr:5'/3'-nucleotidase SurE [Candidatus Acidoferrales bacterium]